MHIDFQNQNTVTLLNYKAKSYISLIFTSILWIALHIIGIVYGRINDKNGVEKANDVYKRILHKYTSISFSYSNLYIVFVFNFVYIL